MALLDKGGKTKRAQYKPAISASPSGAGKEYSTIMSNADYTGFLGNQTHCKPSSTLVNLLQLQHQILASLGYN